MQMKRHFLAAILLAVVIGAAPAHADWPESRVTYVITASSGGGSDLLGRTFAPFLAEELNVEVVPENHPGSAGAVAANFVLQQEADGYMLMQGQVPQLVTKQIENPSIRFNGESWDYIGILESDPWVFAVMKDHEFQSYDDLIAAVEANPGGINCAGGGIGGTHHLTQARWENKTGLDINYVSFDGGSEARAALLGGHVPVVCANTGAINRVADQVRVLAIASQERSTFYPDTPTFRELGVDLVGGTDRTLVVRKGTPEEALEKLRAAFDSIVADPKFVAAMADVRKTVDGTAWEETEARVLATGEEFKEIWDRSPWLENR